MDQYPASLCLPGSEAERREWGGVGIVLDIRPKVVSSWDIIPMYGKHIHPGRFRGVVLQCIRLEAVSKIVESYV
jgi:hypothetical protein